MKDTEQNTRLLLTSMINKLQQGMCTLCLARNLQYLAGFVFTISVQVYKTGFHRKQDLMMQMLQPLAFLYCGRIGLS